MLSKVPSAWGQRISMSVLRKENRSKAIYCVSNGKVIPLHQNTFENRAKMSEILSNSPSPFRLENRPEKAYLSSI